MVRSGLRLKVYGWVKRMFSSSLDTQHSIEHLVDGILRGDRLATSKCITLLESSLAEDEAKVEGLFKRLYDARGGPQRQSIRLGFTGAPGVGKSSLIETFGLHLVDEQKKRLAVLTVDPSSVRSGGSILGDKTRMPVLAQHSAAYIRSSPSQGDSGGVVSSTFDAVRLCEYAGYDVIIVETVGVGQSELAVADLVDMFILIVAPGIGDELQGLKKGITEIADMILVNKADSEQDQSANQTLFEYQSAVKFSMTGAPPKKVLPVSARTGRGIHETWAEIVGFISKGEATIAERRSEQEKNWRATVAQYQLLRRFRHYMHLQKDSLPPLKGTSLKSSALTLLEGYLRATQQQ